MKIGELAKTAHTPAETIRYYEREGLLRPVRRTAGNYRDYNEDDAKRLAFIRQCRAVDMSLDEVRELLKAMDRPRGECHEDVDTLVDQHIEHIVERIIALRAAENTLRAMRLRCYAEQAGTCGVLEGMEQMARESASGAAPHGAPTGRPKPRIH